MLHGIASIRDVPAGSTVLLQREFGVGRFERIRASTGTFKATFKEYAIVFAQGPVHGYVTLNDSQTQSGSNKHPLYSVLRPGDYITGVIEKPTTYEILLLCASYVEGLILEKCHSSNAVLIPKLRIESPQFLQTVWRSMSNFFDAQRETAEPLIMLCIELLLLNLVNGSAGAPSDIIARQHSDALSRAAQFIDQHLGEPIDLRSIAGAAGLSPSYFNRIFKAHHHVSIHRFVLIRRLERVRRLLRETDHAIAAIAVEAGFGSQSHLTTAFRQRYAMTPAQYRTDTKRLRRH